MDVEIVESDQKRWSVYIIRCADRTLYTGVTLDVARRFAEHQAGGAKAARYVRGKRPLTLVFQAEIGPKGEAYRTETAIKQLHRRQKEQLIRGELEIAEVVKKMTGFSLREISDQDRAVIPAMLEEAWGSIHIVSRGRLIDTTQLPGFAAISTKKPKGEIVGLITYEIVEKSCEVVTINNFVTSLRGVGQAMLDAVEAAAREAGCERLWLITTNDNTDALRFYQKRGFQLCALHRDAIVASRKLKPSIPEIGAHGIPIRDELELEKRLSLD